jgi:hypothetical protein
MRAAYALQQGTPHPGPLSLPWEGGRGGGFVVLLVFCFDYVENPEAWHTSMRLLAEEVLPLCADLVPREAAPV